MNDGGPAFPQLIKIDTLGLHGQVNQFSGGMSLRDWFAGMALQGILSPLLGTAPGVSSLNQLSQEKNMTQFEMIAERCYSLADAMLKQREQP